ncbi:hypothetical protein IMG5_173780 [Ichthyophthirius multifiliis]|uniref:Tr-type G domain-containing protein n=1 Tax=Ichthyophthirius multifiliis TaxID=5932 RepID=G0R1Z7_ICHMU|nr:hypothetical protein IMG5_173780 [Ichthyophthirius multifiliis]EGR28522.1 hypothetical protein IMG5_173780 [Ichthyophthirius multifiliis]|eukprot:XP_004029758.1 hypothetical protein IMG5_173780 [Ichthyophthirius multifiliis]
MIPKNPLKLTIIQSTIDKEQQITQFDILTDTITAQVTINCANKGYFLYGVSMYYSSNAQKCAIEQVNVQAQKLDEDLASDEQSICSYQFGSAPLLDTTQGIQIKLRGLQVKQDYRIFGLCEDEKGRIKYDNKQFQTKDNSGVTRQRRVLLDQYINSNDSILTLNCEETDIPIKTVIGMSSETFYFGIPDIVNIYPLSVIQDNPPSAQSINPVLYRGQTWAFLDIPQLTTTSQKQKSQIPEPDGDIEEYMEVLLEHQKNCEKSGKYVEAELAKRRLQELKLEFERRSKDETKQRHLNEKQEIEKAHLNEYNEFNEFWDRKMLEFNQEAEKVEKETIERHQEEMNKFQEEIEQQITQKPKDTPELLHLRKMEEQLAKQQEYMEAHQIQQRIFTIEKEEFEKWNYQRQIKLKNLMQHLRLRQQNEISALRQRIISGQDEQKKIRNQELEKLTQKQICSISQSFNFKQEIQQIRRSLFYHPCSTFALETQEKIIKNQNIINVLNTNDNTKFRNVAIIAHVDHGKTTLVDTLLKQSGLENQKSMDSNALEQEKGITILSKVTGITYKDYKINIVDTPGHQDFGGEVERIMQMVDGVILLICATEGPMTQTKFVLKKALKQKLKPIVIINKVDRPTARCKDVENEILDLFIEMDIPEEDLDYPVYYASGRDGWAVDNLNNIKSDNKKDVSCILDAIVNYVLPPKQTKEGDFQLLISQTESNIYHGKLVIGKINSGVLNVGDKLDSYDRDGKLIESNKVMKIIRRYGQKQVIIFFNFNKLTKRWKYKQLMQVILFLLLDSPIQQFHILQTNKEIKDRFPVFLQILQLLVLQYLLTHLLQQEKKEQNQLSTNQDKDFKKKVKTMLPQEFKVFLKIKNIIKSINQGLGQKDGANLVVEGRGDLHLGVLFENMRREGFEMSLTPPQIIYKQVGNKTFEPVEKVKIETSPIYSSIIIEKLGLRKGVYENCEEITADLHRLTFLAPTRGLIGFRTELMNDTKGTAVMESFFHEYQEHKGTLKKNTKGALICTTDGLCTAYAVKACEKFGQLFVIPGSQVYAGMVIGENQKESDVELNPTKKKELTNVRSKQHEEKILLQPARQFSIEEAISYIRDDEIVEVTPKNLRIRKKELDPNVRAKFIRDQKSKRQS